MKFDLKTPCSNCPFRTDSPRAWLGAERAVEISNSLFGLRNGPFPCHKTIDYDAKHDAEDEAEARGEKVPDGAGYNGQTQHCAGALILMEKSGHQSDCVQLAERLGPLFGRVIYDPAKLDRSAPVFETATEFILHHSDQETEP